MFESVRPMSNRTLRGVKIKAFAESLGGHDMFKHCATAYDVAQAVRTSVKELRENLTAAGELTEEGIKKRLSQVTAPQVMQVKNLRAENARRAQALLAPKADGKVPEMTDGELSRVASHYNAATFSERERLRTAALTGGNDKLAAAMLREPWLFNLTESSKQLLQRRFDTGTPTIDAETERLLSVAATLEEELAELETELTAPPSASETDLQRARRMAKEFEAAQGAAA